jgi:hypothetical protein
LGGGVDLRVARGKVGAELVGDVDGLQSAF